MRLPVAEKVDEGWKDVSKELIDYISLRAKMKYLQDIVLGFRTQIMKGYAAYQKQDIVVFVALNKDGKDLKVENPGALVMMKEYLDGYELTDDYSLKVKV